MPTMPVYNAQRNITPQTEAPFRNEAAQTSENALKITSALQNVTQKWSDAHDVMQYTEAKAKYEVAALDIHMRANADPDFKNSAQYSKELGDLKSNSLEGIDNQAIGNKLGMEIDYNNKISAIKIDSQFKQKEVEYNKVMVKSNLDALLQKKLSAATDAERAQYDDEINALLDANVKSGVLSYEEAAAQLKDSQKTSVKYEIYNDASTQEKDSEILKELRDPKGKYSYLDPKTRLDLVEESQRRIFQNNQTFKRANELSKDTRFQNIFQKANEGTLTLSDLDAEQADADAGDPGALDQKEILSIRKGLQSKIKTDLEAITSSNEKAAKYHEFIDNFIDDETDRQKGRELIVNAFKDGILSTKEAALLNSLKRETEDIQFNRNPYFFEGLKPIIKPAITAIRSFFRGKETSSEQEAALAIKALLNGAADGKEIEKLIPKIINEDRVKTTPDIKTFSETGQLMIDPVTGVKALVFPDGHIEVQK